MHGDDPLQYNETSVFGRLGENHGGVDRPMDPVRCRTPDEFPQIMSVFPGELRTNTERSYKKICPKWTFEGRYYFCPYILKGGSIKNEEYACG